MIEKFELGLAGFPDGLSTGYAHTKMLITEKTHNSNGKNRLQRYVKFREALIVGLLCPISL